MAIKSQNKRRVKTNKKKTKSLSLDLNSEIKREIIAVIYLFLGLFFILVLTGNASLLGEKIDYFLSYLFGIGRYLLIFVFLGVSIALFLSHTLIFNFTRVLGIILLLFSVLGIIHLNAPYQEMDLKLIEYGGGVGFLSSVLLRVFVGEIASFFVLLGVMIVAVLLTFQKSLTEIINFFRGIKNLPLKKYETEDFYQDAEIKIIKGEKRSEEKETKSSDKVKRISLEGIKINKPKTKNLKKPAIEITDIEVSDNFKLPSLELLIDEISNNFPEDNILHNKAQNIRNKLKEFGISVEMVDARVGPTVTQFTMSPQEGVPVKKIANAKEDLALSLAASSVRVEAPIPGQPYVGIEIPNDNRSTVYMREILESEEFSKISSNLRLAIGKDVSGLPVVTDLAKMPHLLIAGATGSGKSVGMNSFLISLLYQNSPSQLKFIMVDPKRVELKAYNGIPHLLTPVITEAEKALAALKWSVSEMMRRYEDLAEKGYRNLAEYNEVEEKKMPNIVIVVDELADLMMRDFKKDTEAAICRLAQMARAVGMHLIIATQRPSVDVITGVIKANIPTRISFTVTSSVDSRTVLDTVGAEDLLGQGDMLFVDANTPKPKRIQGIFVSSKEIEKVTNYIKVTPEEGAETIDLEEKKEDIAFDLEAIANAANEDELVPEAIEIIKNNGKASATLLQRTLSVGYARAAKILDILEDKGLIGPANGAKPRELFLDRF